jgi:hypothetical protein
MNRETEPNHIRTLNQLPEAEPGSKVHGWFKEMIETKTGKYLAGFVVGVMLCESNPQRTMVFFDGGRRRKTNDGTEGIVLESLQIDTEDFLKLNVKEGDLIMTNIIYYGFKKIASAEELVEKGVISSLPEVEWDKVLGAIY